MSRIVDESGHSLCDRQCLLGVLEVGAVIELLHAFHEDGGYHYPYCSRAFASLSWSV